MPYFVNRAQEPRPMFLKNAPMIFAVMIAAAAVHSGGRITAALPPGDGIAVVSLTTPGQNAELLVLDPNGIAEPMPIDASVLAAESPAHLVVTNPEAVAGMTGLQAVLYADALPPRQVPITVAARRESRDAPSGSDIGSRALPLETQFAAASRVNLQPDPSPD